MQIKQVSTATSTGVAAGSSGGLATWRLYRLVDTIINIYLEIYMLRNTENNAQAKVYLI